MFWDLLPFYEILEIVVLDVQQLTWEALTLMVLIVPLHLSGSL